MKKSIFLFFAAILCAIGMSAATPTKIYLNAQNWGYSDARYAAYFFDPAKWVDMKKVDGETFIYEVDVPAGYTKVILCRMNGSTTANSWSNKWNQTGDLTIPTDGRNMFKPDDWNGKTTTWSTYTPTVTHTFAKNSTLYIDFRAITDKKGANYPKAGSVGIDYSANAGGTVIPVTFTADVKWAEGSEFLKTEKGGWASISFKVPEAGQNCAQVAADGKSYTWTTFSEPSVTLSLDKTEADAGTEVTVNLTATADNVSGEVTYAFQYSTDNATWNNITATDNTATQTFAAETRYYKVTMTNGGTTKEATAKFSAIKFHVIGSWDTWAAHNEVVEGSKTITLEANKTYEYKITNGTWDLSWGNDGTMKRSDCTNWSFESNNNAKIKTDEAGDYVFNVSRNAEGKVQVSVTYPEQTETPEPVVDVYTVVGSDVLLGTAWDLNNADNEMTKQDDGSYVLVKENVDLAKTGTYEYKVVKNHDWAWSVPSGNANLTLKLGNEDVDGTYNVTFTLNKELNALTTSLELVEAKKVIPECYVAGDESLTGQDWNAKSVSMTYDETTEVYTATLTAVPAGTHNMKVVYGGEWLGFDHLATSAPANVKEGDDKKIQFTLAEAGDVTVTYHATNGIGLTGNFAAPVTYDYYIAGTLAGAWSATQQGMIKDDDVYKHTFSELAAGTYEFKITDGQWNNDGDATHEHTTLGAAYEEVSYNEGNIKIVTEKAINLTVIFNAATDKITFEGLTEKTINYVDIKFTITANSAPQIHYWADYITGTDWDNLPEMTPTANPNEYTFTIEGVDQEKGVNYLLKIGNLQTADQSTKTDVVADLKDLLLISIYGIDGWEAANAIHLTIADDYATATANIELAAETTYAFKVNIGNKWLGNKSTMTSDNCTGWTFAEKDGEEDMPNAGITTTIAGEYTFTWNVADNKLSVTYPTLPTPEVIRTGLTAGNYYTICMNKEMKDVKGATLWSFCGKDANFAYLVQEDAPYTAGKAYIMYAEAETVSAILTGEPALAPVANGAIYGTFADMDQAALDAAGDNIYLVIGNQLRRVDGQTGNSLPANRAYVDIDKIEITGGAPAGIPANRVRSMPMQPQVATGMENVDASAQPVKTIINGQLFILRGEKMYDAQGKLVK